MNRCPVFTLKTGRKTCWTAWKTILINTFCFQSLFRFSLLPCFGSHCSLGRDWIFRFKKICECGKIITNNKRKLSNASDVTSWIYNNTGDVTCQGEKEKFFMATTKKRIAAYVTEETVKKFKIVSATKNKSMSEYAEMLIQKAVEEYEQNYGIIKIENQENATTPKNNIETLINSGNVIVGDNSTINM